MGIFELFTRPRMDEGIEAFRATEKAVLLDVRTPEEYAEGHVAGSRNLPLDRIPTAQTVVPDKDTPLFVYCRSGGRSGQAVSMLRRMGYSDVKNIGGIINYHGKVERDR